MESPFPAPGSRQYLLPKPLFRFSATKTPLPALKIPHMPPCLVWRVVPALGGMSAVTPHPPGDTAFIILRKRPLIFVHWYHHSTVLLYSSFGYKDKVAAGGWFMTMNYGVHAIMYTYYTLRAAKVKPPKWFSMFITSLQILQMFLGATVSILTYIWKQEQGCHTTTEQLFWSFMLYMTYFLLFAQFFHQNYIIPKAKAKTKSQ